MELIQVPNTAETDIKQIPKGWSIKSLNELGIWKGGGTPSKINSTFWKGNIPWVSPKDFNGIHISSSEDYITESAILGSATNLISANSIIVVIRSGILRNRVPIAKNLVPVAINQDVKALTVNESYDIDFIFYALVNSEQLIRKKIVKVGTTVESIDFRALKEFEIALPNTKVEQAAIATALSDTDALISRLEKLIAKKRAVKQVAMQELFRPKEGWQIRKLGDIARITMGQSPLSEFYNDDGIGLPLIQGNADIENRKTIVRFYTSSITKTGKLGDIIMSVRAPVGEIARATFDCCLGRGVCAINYDNNYLYHYLIHLEKSWSKLSSGSTFDSVNSRQVRELELAIPDSKEIQIQIAEILGEMDLEIGSLESKLSKYRQIKSGMMQSLLTGKIRLV